jgi:predicted DCC family thiol-disulfide oxidoreductase YuxK
MSAPKVPVPEARPIIVYDGDCPFCSRYVAFLRLREAVGPVTLINARGGGPIVEEVRRAGYDLDEGMVLKMGDRYYHGADCIHVLALMTSDSSLFNKLTARVFRSSATAGALYPFLRAGRNATLRMLGRRKIAATDLPEGGRERLAD